ncbi:MAG: hypothetical protein JW870_07265 [Candidatus Delongbacteria bacterium]|nr:hypothetical protein [Candidatus Delongbacteria bacterium]
MKQTIVIFANSVKYGEHCVAGKEIKSKKWIRPVSDSNGGALTRSQAKCTNPHGTFCVKVLQIVEVGLQRRVPLVNQPENYLIDNTIWKQFFKLDPQNINPFLDHPNLLWENLDSSSSGQNDKIAFKKIQLKQISISQSLYLIKPGNIMYHVISYKDKKRIRVSFNYNKVSYNLATTDPGVWSNFDEAEIGYVSNDKNESILCISLGKPFTDGFCYKLVASVIPTL